MKFEATVLEWGPDALMFLEDPDNPFVVLFNETAPDALKEMSLIHDGKEVTKAPAPGDTVKFGEFTYKITAVGDEAKATLKTLGHCTLKFTAKDAPDLPGCIHLDGPVPTASDIVQGMKISISD